MPWSNQGGGWQGAVADPWARDPGARGRAAAVAAAVRHPIWKRSSARPGAAEVHVRRRRRRRRHADAQPHVWLVGVVAIAAIFAYNSFYQVQPNERGVVLQFGKYSHTTGPGLNYLMWPVQRVETVAVLDENQINFGASRART
jgi:modulator of FtsH protease HflK